MPKLEERIASAETRLKQLKARQQRALARKRSIAAKNQRSQDVRRKILVGAIVLARVEAGELPAADLNRWLDAALTRADDRALFELPVPPPAPAP
jgi:hypothetical protein